jgi:hypothetical protein
MHPSTQAHASTQGQPTQSPIHGQPPTPAHHHTELNIPAGYSVRQMPDGLDYIVPNFLISDADLAMQSELNKASSKIKEAPGGVSALCSFFIPASLVG